MVSGSRIVVMDEATANVDRATDGKIQRALRRTFGQSSMLIIAHRLETITHCDRVVVLSAGEVAEIGPPAELRSNPRSLFAQLLEQTQRTRPRPGSPLAPTTHHFPRFSFEKG
jgi:ABC-type multidrug transport system fused ATPase/permease subunit